MGGTSKALGEVVTQSAVPILLQYDEVTGAIDWHRQITSSALADISP